MTLTTDSIERKVLLKASLARVWHALSNAEEFGKWFGVNFEDKTFVVGKHVQGRITYPGYEHLLFEVFIERMEPDSLLAWRWHPAAIDPGVDYSQEPTTLVVFELAAVAGGTLLTVVESGLDKIPVSRRAAVFRMSSSGWDEQMKSIEQYLAST